MASRNDAAEDRQIVSPNRVGDELRVIFALARARGFTLERIADDSGVKITTIRGWIDEGKEPSFSKALSVAAVCGEWAVNKLIAIIGYGGATPLEETSAKQPMQIVANSMQHFAVIAQAAADNRIDHTEEKYTREAADGIIAELIPLSSAGRAA